VACTLLAAATVSLREFKKDIMKVYTPSEPPYLMRINIKKQGEQTEFIKWSVKPTHRFYVGGM
jgi:hypothetical protein